MLARIFFATLVFGSALYLATNASFAATTYYVSPTGVDTNNGTTTSSPFATFSKAISSAIAGDTILARGGTYNISSTLSISSSKNGTAVSPYKLQAYPGETPVLDFTTAATDTRGIQLDGSYWNIKGLTIQRAHDNGINITGSNNVLDTLRVSANQDSGVQLSGNSSRQPSNNLIVNVDSFNNYDPVNHGENADGFAAKFRDLGPGNVFRGNRAWGNSDDGWDFWGAANAVVVENSWAFKNGFNTFGDTAFAGDGNGYKLGHDSGDHQLKNSLAWGNRLNGIDINGNATNDSSIGAPIAHAGVTIHNFTAYNNGQANFYFDENFPHILRNNISYLSGSSLNINAGVLSDHNTWNSSTLAALAGDFLSFDDTIAAGPRLADGSLPTSNFLRLNPLSHLVNKGTNVGLPFNGIAPDLGAFETIPEPGTFAFLIVAGLLVPVGMKMHRRRV